MVLEKGEVMEKPRKPGTFVPGDPRIGPLQKKAKGPEVIPDRREGEGVGLLRAMRAVLLNHEKRDEGAEEKAARRWFKKDEARFLNRKHELEEEERVSGRGGSSVGVVDVGEGECRQLLGRLMSEFRESGDG